MYYGDPDAGYSSDKPKPSPTSSGGFSQSGAQISANVSGQEDVQRYRSTGSNGGSTPRYVSKGGGGGSRELTPTGYKSTGSGRTVTRNTAGASGGGGASGGWGGISDPETKKVLRSTGLFPGLGPDAPVADSRGITFRQAVEEKDPLGLGTGYGRANPANDFLNQPVGGLPPPPAGQSTPFRPQGSPDTQMVFNPVTLGGGELPVAPGYGMRGSEFRVATQPETVSPPATVTLPGSPVGLPMPRPRPAPLEVLGGMNPQDVNMTLGTRIGTASVGDTVANLPQVWEIGLNGPTPPADPFKQIYGPNYTDIPTAEDMAATAQQVGLPTNPYGGVTQRPQPRRTSPVLTPQQKADRDSAFRDTVKTPLVPFAAGDKDFTAPILGQVPVIDETQALRSAADRKGIEEAVAGDQAYLASLAESGRRRAAGTFTAPYDPVPQAANAFDLESASLRRAAGTPTSPYEPPASLRRAAGTPTSPYEPPASLRRAAGTPTSPYELPLTPPPPGLGFGIDPAYDLNNAPYSMGTEVGIGGGPSVLGQLPLTEAMLSRREASNYDTMYADSEDTWDWRPSENTIQENYDFGRSGYGAWVKKNNPKGDYATPMGRYAFVGDTMLEVADEMGLPRDTKFTPDVQDAMFAHLAKSRIGNGSDAEAVAALKGTWDGFKKEDDADVLAVVNEMRGAFDDPSVALSIKNYNPVDPLALNMGVEVGSEGDTVPSFGAGETLSDDPSALYKPGGSEPTSELLTPYADEGWLPMPTGNAESPPTFGSEVGGPLPDGRFPIDFDGIPEVDATGVKPENVRGAVPEPDGESVVVDHEVDGEIKRVKIPWYAALAMGLVAGPLGSMAASSINAMGGIPIDPNAKPGERYQSGGGRGFSEFVDGDGGTPSIPTDAPPWWPPGMPWPPVSSDGTGPTVPPYEPPPPQDYTRYQTSYNPVQSAFEQGIGGMVQGMRDGGMVAPYASSRGSLQSTMNNGALGFRR